jgi:hypothetical protein
MLHILNSEIASFRKKEAVTLAKKISSARENNELKIVLQEMKKFEISNGQSQRSPVPAVNNDHLGIWTLNPISKTYERSEEFMDAWSYWANIDQIPLKKRKANRIVFTGESVARGYFYDPHYTPAKVLEEILSSAGAEAEIVDLAKIDMTMEELLCTVKESMVLEPDIVVIFAGNNFYLNLLARLDNRQTQQLDHTPERNNFSDIFAELENELGQAVDELMVFFEKLAAEHRIKVLFVIPEYNLADWRVPQMAKPLPNLKNGKLLQWRDALEELPGLILKGDLERAERLSELLIALDLTHPAGYEFMAQVKLKQQDLIKAKEYFEVARDTSFRSVGRPRIFSVIRSRILSKASISQDVRILDLPAIFATHLNGRIPGRHLFLDYCHLTAEGIQASMAHVAHIVLHHFLQAAVPLEEVMQYSCDSIPDDETVSKAHFFAAIHNAHNNQGYDIIQHHCARSIEASGNITDFMLLFLDMASRKAPNVVCKSFEEVMSLMDEQRYHAGFSSPRNSKLLDVTLTRAILDVLKDKGIDHEPRMRTLQNEEHGVRYRKVNLLESFYSKTDYDQRVGRQLPYYQAFDLKSVFYLVAERGLPVEFRITCKSRSISGEEDLRIEINNIPVTTLRIDNKWGTNTFACDPDILTDGVNTVTIYWPLSDNNHVFSGAASSFSDLIDVMSYRSGEIYSFEACHMQGATQ